MIFKWKVNEILLVLCIEKYFFKDEIVIIYLNVFFFGCNNKGENIVGVEEAVKGFFGKSVKDLNFF